MKSLGQLHIPGCGVVDLRSDLWGFAAVAGEQGNVAFDDIQQPEKQQASDTHAYLFKMCVSMSKETRDALLAYMHWLDAGNGVGRSSKSGINVSISKKTCLLILKVLEFPEDQAMLREAMKKVRTNTLMFVFCLLSFGLLV